MVPPKSESSYSEPTSAVDAETASEPASVGLDFPAERFGRLLVFAAVAGLVAGVASELIGERILNSYKSDLFPPLEISPSAENVRRWKDARLYTPALTFTTLGGLLGLALGLAGGMARRSILASVSAAILGLLLGSIAAASSSLIFVSIFFKVHDPQSSDLVFPLFTHGVIWSAVGAVGGLAFGLGLGGRGRWKATLAGGLTGAAAATVVYELVGALVFATSKTDLPLSSSSTTRAMALLLVASFTAIGAVLALRQPAKRGAGSAAST